MKSQGWARSGEVTCGMVIEHFHSREFDAGGRSSGFVVDLRREMLNSRRSRFRQTAVKSS